MIVLIAYKTALTVPAKFMLALETLHMLTPAIFLDHDSTFWARPRDEELAKICCIKLVERLKPFPHTHRRYTMSNVLEWIAPLGQAYTAL